ncbi:hypothetical protein OKW30_006627 [Paraburkholderia sp. Clong3]
MYEVNQGPCPWVGTGTATWPNGRGAETRRRDLAQICSTSGVDMKPQLIRRPAASGGTRSTYRRYVAASRARFFAQAAGSSVDLLTLVVAESLERRAQAEIRRDLLRDALYAMPVRAERSAAQRRDDDETDV